MVSDINSESLSILQNDEFLPAINSWTTVGAGAIVITFSTAVTLAATLNYNVTVKVPANIRPTGELRIVQAATEGTIKSISVKENQVVKKGEHIAKIDDSQLQTKKFQLQGNIKHSYLQLQQLNAQIQSLDSQIKAENNFINRSIASAKAALVFQERSYQNKQQIATAQVQGAKAALDLAKEEMQRYQQLANTGAIAKLQVSEKQQAFRMAMANLQQAQVNLNPTNAEVTMAMERIAEEQARGVSNLAALQKERKNLLSTLFGVQNQINQDKEALQQIERELSKVFIVAPIDGTILKLDLRNSGQVVGAGSMIAQIAPSHASLVVKAYIPEADINKVKPGQQVQMRVSACPYPDYGILAGTVKTVAPDVVAASNSAGGKSLLSGSYEVTIQPKTSFVGDGDHSCQLQAGMEGRADIISRQESVLHFILRKARLLSDM
jgi:HlyD family secretion protein